MVLMIGDLQDGLNTQIRNHAGLVRVQHNAIDQAAELAPVDGILRQSVILGAEIGQRSPRLNKGRERRVINGSGQTMRQTGPGKRAEQRQDDKDSGSVQQGARHRGGTLRATSSYG